MDLKEIDVDCSAEGCFCGEGKPFGGFGRVGPNEANLW